MQNMQKLAIFGGSFNPVHYGHLLMAETALTQFSLDQVIWVPTYQPPHKSTEELIGFEHRFNMVQQAIASHSHFICSDIEFYLAHRSSPANRTYAIDTLMALQIHYPQSRWYWLIGVDAFQSLPHWYRHQDLVAHCDWLVAPRFALDGSDPPPAACSGETALASTASSIRRSALNCEQVAQTLKQRSIELTWYLLPMPLIEISSGLIRRYCRDRRSIRYLVPEPVRTYISTHALYLDQTVQA
ncbi:nicotinate (nicotinamide) nucleotide adenylyltransferase [Egbenema bharatensis]|uniref:nicotinate (nicotinamide) nucleotide adenylyltransferase n=1 Tax=Egbenema bharatensis TaxID=3463334 RepID=UPI003A8821DA